MLNAQNETDLVTRRALAEGESETASSWVNTRETRISYVSAILANGCSRGRDKKYAANSEPK